MNTQKQDKGFTIIEVVLVLAIAALIFLMIFVALPALQRGQRDTARKNDAGVIASAVTTFRTNNSGNPLTSGSQATFNSEYIEKLSQVEEPIVVSDSYSEPAEDRARVVTSAKCSNDDNVVDTSGTSRQAAVVVFVENGGVYCQDA
jgi:prepilin-type N-terminal cleavage/methylation domain-containing protein